MAEATPQTEKPELHRAIGPKLLLFFVVGDILGTGIYALTGNVAGKIGGALWLPFLLAFVVAFLTAFSYLELVGKYPRAAGAALYTNKAFKIHFLTFMVAFAVMCSGITSASRAALAFGRTYLRQLLVEFFDVALSPESLVITGIAIVFIAALAIINFRGVSESVKANVVLTCIELSGLVIIILIGAYAVINGDGEPGRLTEIHVPSGSNVLLAVTSATALAFFAMVGFEDSVNMAEECRNPVKIFPRAMLWGMGIAAPDLRAGRDHVVAADPVRRAREGRQQRVAEGRHGRRARLPAVDLRVDRPAGRHQLGADQHADGQPPALRHGEREDHPEVLRRRAPVPPHAVDLDRLHDRRRGDPGVAPRTSASSAARRRCCC